MKKREYVVCFCDPTCGKERLTRARSSLLAKRYTRARANRRDKQRILIPWALDQKRKREVHGDTLWSDEIRESNRMKGVISNSQNEMCNCELTEESRGSEYKRRMKRETVLCKGNRERESR